MRESVEGHARESEGTKADGGARGDRVLSLEAILLERTRVQAEIELEKGHADVDGAAAAADACSDSSRRTSTMHWAGLGKELDGCAPGRRELSCSHSGGKGGGDRLR